MQEMSTSLQIRKLVSGKDEASMPPYFPNKLSADIALFSVLHYCCCSTSNVIHPICC